jgi:predicted MFS family arabinose efflux permease
MLCSASALAAGAFAPTFISMLAALGAVGLTTVAGQILTPLAGDLALPEQRGRVVGTVVSGLITGILLSRTISGFFAHAFGWRAIYEAAALLMVVLAIVLAQALPPEGTRPSFHMGRCCARSSLLSVGIDR